MAGPWPPQGMRVGFGAPGGLLAWTPLLIGAHCAAALARGVTGKGAWHGN